MLLTNLLSFVPRGGIEIDRKRVRRRKRIDLDEQVDEGLTIQNELKRRFLEATDTLVHQVRNRHSRLTELLSVRIPVSPNRTL